MSVVASRVFLNMETKVNRLFLRTLEFFNQNSQHRTEAVEEHMTSSAFRGIPTQPDYTQYRRTFDLLVPKGARVNGLQHYLSKSNMVTQVNVSKSSVIQGLLLDEILRPHVKR